MIELLTRLFLKFFAAPALQLFPSLFIEWMKWIRYDTLPLIFPDIESAMEGLFMISLTGPGAEHDVQTILEGTLSKVFLLTGCSWRINSFSPRVTLTSTLLLRSRFRPRCNGPEHAISDLPPKAEGYQFRLRYNLSSSGSNHSISSGHGGHRSTGIIDHSVAVAFACSTTSSMSASSGIQVRQVIP